nr:MAG TPA: hypothetical protein [Caudoviricetes sp.]
MINSRIKRNYNRKKEIESRKLRTNNSPLS